MDNSLLVVRDINHKYIVVERSKFLFKYINAEIFYTLYCNQQSLPCYYYSKNGMYIHMVYKVVAEIFEKIEKLSNNMEDPFVQIEESFLIDHFLSFSQLDFLSQNYLKYYTNFALKNTFSPERDYTALFMYQSLFMLPNQLLKQEINKFDKAINLYFDTKEWDTLEPFLKRYTFIGNCFLPTLQTLFVLFLYASDSNVNDKINNIEMRIENKLYDYLMHNQKKYIYYKNMYKKIKKLQWVQDYEKYLEKLNYEDNKTLKGNTGRDYQQQLQFYISFFFYFNRQLGYSELCQRMKDKVISEKQSISYTVNNNSCEMPFDTFVERQLLRMKLDYDIVSDKANFPNTKLYHDFKR